MRKLPLLSVLLLSACVMGPDYHPPAMDLPGHWPAPAVIPAEAQSVINLDWWKQFNDPVLTKLEEEGLAANSDIAQAAARVEQARGALDLRWANQFPELDAQADATRTRNSARSSFGGFPANPKPYNSFGLAAVLNYEINLFGKLTRSTEAARARLLAAEHNRDAVRLRVAADIAVAYFNLRALDAQAQVTENTVAAREGAYDYQNKQYQGGVTNALTYRQAEAELAAAKAQAPLIAQARAEQETALSILLGRSPKELAEVVIERGASLDDLPVPPLLPADLPSELLTRRPDIQAAEQNLVASNAEIGVARADYFPTLSLSGLLGVASSKTGTLVEGAARNWNASGSLAGPLFDFGRVSANVDQAIAQKDQALAAYAQTVRTAFKEALDSLSGVQNAAARVDAQATQVQARVESLRLAGLRYDAGYSNYLEVLDAERFLYQAQLERIDARRDQLAATVNLYKALGGGWAPQK